MTKNLKKFWKFLRKISKVLDRLNKSHENLNFSLFEAQIYLRSCYVTPTVGFIPQNPGKFAKVGNDPSTEGF